MNAKTQTQKSFIIQIIIISSSSSSSSSSNLLSVDLIRRYCPSTRCSTISIVRVVHSMEKSNLLNDLLVSDTYSREI